MSLLFLELKSEIKLSFLIKLENVCKSYPLGESSYQALKGVDFTLMRGEMTAIVGVSGSGKSTLMNIIGFLDRASSGRYFFDGLDVSQISKHDLADIRNQKIGFVFQSFFLLLRANALQNVMLPLFYRGTPHEEARAKAMEMLDKVGVAHLATHKPNQLSGGQQQRVAIARALVSDPQVILADEPTGALDSKTSDEVMRLLTDLNQKEGRTIIIITHDKGVSERCTRMVSIKDGKLI